MMNTRENRVIILAARRPPSARPSRERTSLAARGQCLVIGVVLLFLVGATLHAYYGVHPGVIALLVVMTVAGSFIMTCAFVE